MIVYGIKPSEWIPTAYIIDEWVLLAKSMLKLTFTGGLLFPRLHYNMEQ